MPKDESPIERVVVEGLGRLPQFCHATIADGWIHISGTLGTQTGSMDLMPGGTGPQTTQTLRNMVTILEACGVGMADVVKMSVFLADMDTFPEMNEAYSAVMGSDPPARITVGKAGLALGAAVEIEGIAYRPNATANGSE
jgi:2-iminobutanoate/2-iminopropanoate deaminase